VLALTVLAAAAWACGRRWRVPAQWLCSLGTARPSGQAALLVLAVAVVGGYLVSSWSGAVWSATAPRYLLPLYTLTPLAARALFPADATRLRLIWGVIVALLLMGANLLVSGSAPPLQRLQPIATRLLALGVRSVDGDYWIVYRLAWISNERLVPVVVTPTRRLGLNRYPPYLMLASRASPGAWVLPAGSHTERVLRACLRRHRREYRRFDFDGLVIYAPLAAPQICVVVPQGWPAASTQAANQIPPRPAGAHRRLRLLLAARVE
jgi:hypothetical protein